MFYLFIYLFIFLFFYFFCLFFYRYDFTYFRSTISPILPVRFESVGISVQDTTHKIDFFFQDCGNGDHLGCPFEAILAFFFFLSTNCPDTSKDVSSQMASRLRRSAWQPTWIFDQNDFICFDQQVARFFLLSF